MSYTDSILDQAQQALREGRKGEVRRLVAPIVEAEPQNGRAWHLLADASDDEAQAQLYRDKAGQVGMPVPQRTPPPPPPVQTYQQPQAPPQPVYYAPPPPAKRNPLAAIILTLIVGAGVWFFLANGSSSGGRATPGRSTFGSSSSSSHKVEYKVSGTAHSVSLTYQNASGGTEQKDASLPWSQSYTVPNGTFLYVSAQNKGTSGKVTCTILIDGKVFKTSTSEGAYKIADCSGGAR